MGGIFTKPECECDNRFRRCVACKGMGDSRDGEQYIIHSGFGPALSVEAFHCRRWWHKRIAEAWMEATHQSRYRHVTPFIGRLLQQNFWHRGTEAKECPYICTCHDCPSRRHGDPEEARQGPFG